MGIFETARFKPRSSSQHSSNRGPDEEVGDIELAKIQGTVSLLSGGIRSEALKSHLAHNDRPAGASISGEAEFKGQRAPTISATPPMEGGGGANSTLEKCQGHRKQKRARDTAHVFKSARDE